MNLTFAISQYKQLDVSISNYWHRVGLELMFCYNKPIYDHWGFTIAITLLVTNIEIHFYDIRHVEDL